MEAELEQAVRLWWDSEVERESPAEGGPDGKGMPCEEGPVMAPAATAGFEKGSCSLVASWPSRTNRIGRQRLSSCINEEF